MSIKEVVIKKNYCQSLQQNIAEWLHLFYENAGKYNLDVNHTSCPRVIMDFHYTLHKIRGFSRLLLYAEFLVTSEDTKNCG